MSRIEQLLRRPSAESIDRGRDPEPEVVAIDDGRADEVFEALSSKTARTVLAELHDQPLTASDAAEAADTSIQNVHYHLNELSDAGLVEVVETWYSEQGREMDVYAPTSAALVLFAGDDAGRESLSSSVLDLLGLVSVFALLAVVVERVVRGWTARPDSTTPEDMKALDQPVVAAPSPGVVFFVGALLALLVAAAWWRYRAE